MKIRILTTIALITFLFGCASEFSISPTDVPQAVITAFNSKYPGATEVGWEVEKEEGKLYFEAEFKMDGKKKEAYFRPDGTFGMEE